MIFQAMGMWLAMIFVNHLGGFALLSVLAREEKCLAGGADMVEPFGASVLLIKFHR